MTSKRTNKFSLDGQERMVRLVLITRAISLALDGLPVDAPHDGCERETADADHAGDCRADDQLVRWIGAPGNQATGTAGQSAARIAV